MRRPGARPGARRGALALASLVLLIAACRTNGNVPTGVAATVPPGIGTVPPGAGSSSPPTPEPASPPPVDQLETDWGPIWARVPEAFPVPPGAEPAEADTTVSAAWTVPATTQPAARAVAQFYLDQFSAAGLGGGLDGPLEDGSYTAWASNGYGCDILVTAQRRGDEETFATVLFGAGCPFRWLASG